jgi:hypothetical protein
VADHGRLALAVYDAAAEHDQALVERDPRVGEMDLAARGAADAQPVALDLALRLERLAGAATRLGDEEELQGSVPATSR